MRMTSDDVVLHPMRFHSFAAVGRLIAFGEIAGVGGDGGRSGQYFVFSGGNLHYRNLMCRLSSVGLYLVCTWRRQEVGAVGFRNQTLRISYDYHYERMHYLCGELRI